MSHVNNANFSKSKFALLFLQTTKNSFGTRKSTFNARMEYSQ